MSSDLVRRVKDSAVIELTILTIFGISFIVMFFGGFVLHFLFDATDLVNWLQYVAVVSYIQAFNEYLYAYHTYFMLILMCSCFAVIYRFFSISILTPGAFGIIFILTCFMIIFGLNVRTVIDSALIRAGHTPIHIMVDYQEKARLNEPPFMIRARCKQHPDSPGCSVAK